jgi:hypothetical protein
VYAEELGNAVYSSNILLKHAATGLSLPITAEAAFDSDSKPDTFLEPANMRIFLRAADLGKQPLPALTMLLGRLQISTRLLGEKGFRSPVGRETDIEDLEAIEFILDIGSINRFQLHALKSVFSLKKS